MHLSQTPFHSGAQVHTETMCIYEHFEVESAEA